MNLQTGYEFESCFAKCFGTLPMRALIAAPMALFAIMALSGSATAQMVSPGEDIRIDPSALPAPGVTASVANPPEYEVRPEGTTITVPAGFAVNVFAKDFDNPRWLQIAPNGDVFVASAGKITVLRDADGDGTAETRSTFVSGLNFPHGMAFRPGSLYVADPE